MLRIVLVLFLLQIAWLSSNAQDAFNLGIPLVSNFKTTETGGGIQNWSATQDDQGLLYFGNNNGILEYDGANWRILNLDNGAIVRCVAKMKDSRVYVGGYNRFGFLYPDNDGNTRIKYLSDQVDLELRNFGEIWKIFETDDGIVFQSFSSLFVYDSVLTVIAYNEDFNFAHQASNGEIFIGHNEKGLLTLRNRQLIPVEGGDMFKKQAIASVFRIGDDELMVATTEKGVFISEANGFKFWEAELNDNVKDQQIYCGLRLDEHTLAYGTIRNGIYIADIKGHTVQHISKKNGLQNNSVLNMELDYDGNLWACLDNGIDLVEINSPVSRLFPEGDLGTGYVSLVYNKRLYLGTNQGLFVQDYIEGGNISNQIPKLVEGTSGQVWNIQNIDGQLLCGHHNGAFQIVGDKAIKISDEKGCWKFEKLGSNEDILLAGTYSGLIVLEKGKNTQRYNFKTQIKNFSIASREFQIDSDGIIWVSHGHQGVYRISLSPNFDSAVEVTKYTVENGLPSNNYNSVVKIKGRIYITTVNGIYYYDEVSDDFKQNKKLTEVLGKMKITKMYETSEGDIWFFQNDRLGILRIDFNGNYSKEIIEQRSLEGIFVQNYEHIFPINHGAFIVSVTDGFLFYSSNNRTVKGFSFQTKVRELRNSNGDLLYGGFKNIGVKEEAKEINVPREVDAFSATASAFVYSNSHNIEYSFWLENYDDSWTAWSTKNGKEYSKLPGGNYTLHVKARNELLNVSNEGTLQVKVAYPWYWNLASIIIYFLLFALITFISVKAVDRKIEREKELIKQKQINEIKNKEKQFENERLLKQQEITQLKNKMLEVENEKNKSELVVKSRELASIVMKISYTNELLNKTREQLLRISQVGLNKDSKEQIKRMVKSLEREMNQEDDWKKFEIHFDKVHENFIGRLRSEFPILTPKDLKMAAYLRMNLSSKEIAELLNLSPRGVETSRYRLRKKMNVNGNANLTEYLMNV